MFVSVVGVAAVVVVTVGVVAAVVAVEELATTFIQYATSRSVAAGLPVSSP